jgi:hypothetical protein
VSYFAIKAILSGLLIAAISEIASRSPVVAALVASLPLISILGLLLLTITMHLARGLGYLHGQLAKTLLVSARAPG